MASELTRIIIQRAYSLDGTSLDARALELGGKNWMDLTQDLTFTEAGIGGGLAVLMAPLTEGFSLVISDGEADLPTNPDQFWLAILDDEDDVVFSLSQGGVEGKRR